MKSESAFLPHISEDCIAITLIVVLLIQTILLTKLIMNQKTENKKTSNRPKKEPNSGNTKSQIKNFEKTGDQDHTTQNNPSEDPPNSKTNKSWFILSDSIIGVSHLKNSPPQPCQDSNCIKKINDEWGVAVVCDGMGSKRQSDKGSQFVSKKITETLYNVVLQNKWVDKRVLPSNDNWSKIAIISLYQTFNELIEHTRKNKWPLTEVGCTVIAVIYSPIGLLITHIGDGRAGYCDTHGTWTHMMKPFRGEEANQTIAITSAIWNSPDKYIRSHVINSSVQAFCLMSDGCESFAYETDRWNEEKQYCEEINKPADVFFNPVIKTIKKVQKEHINWQDELNKSWNKLLTNGNKLIEQEPDDKTMIFGTLLDLPTK